MTNWPCWSVFWTLKRLKACPRSVLPRQMDPLTFRLFETIGEPVPTANLPRAYAVADLRDVAGWKAQLEAAERLTRAGALPDNRLLGLYTDTQARRIRRGVGPCAALQRFETALSSGSADAVAKTLPTVWSAMHGAGLEVAFATSLPNSCRELRLTGMPRAWPGKYAAVSGL